MSISSLRRYQRPRGAPRFADLPPDQRAVAEAHYERLCARWGDDLPQWRRAILVGRAKDLVLRPRDANWGRELRKRRQQTAAPVVNTSTALAPPPLRPAPATPPSDPRASPPAQVASSTEAVSVVSPRAPAKMASSPLPTNKVASSLSAPSTLTPPSPHAVHLDIRGLTASGRDGADPARRLAPLRGVIPTARDTDSRLLPAQQTQHHRALPTD